MATAAFLTLGCKVNQFETETMEGLFKQAGYDVVPFEAAADVYVINTCSVTTLGEKKSRQMIRRAQRQNEAACIVATGCYAQLAPALLAALPGVRLVVGTKDRARIVELVEEAMAQDGVLTDVGNIMEADTFEDIPLFGTPARTRAFLKIQEGCQNFCPSCIIPYARGPLRSRPPASVRAEAEKLLAAGFREIVLTGIHLGAYGAEKWQAADAGRVTLADAAREVLALPGLARLRLGSLESIELSEALLALMRTHPQFARHLHLPLQAGTDAILQAMHRHYTTAAFSKLLKEVREAVPEVAISTDIIVGFPGETDEQFEESLRFVATLGFAKMHVFPYSRRPGTPAAKMPNQVPTTVKKARVHRMQQLADEMAATYHASFIGKEADVLFETQTGEITDGLTDTYVRVYTDSPVVLGDITRVRIERLHEDGVWASV